MSVYVLKLINGDSRLDLREKTKAIYQAVQHILNGGKNGEAYLDVADIRILKITKCQIVLDGTETGTDWHKAIGNQLANNYDMRNYTNPNNSAEMFAWE